MEITQEKIEQVAQKIAREYKPEKIILFGSWAWGKPGPNSDVDLFLVKETGERKIDRARRVRKLIWGSGLPIDILVYTPAEVKRRLEKFEDFFVQDVTTKGKVLYSRT